MLCSASVGALKEIAYHIESEMIFFFGWQLFFLFEMLKAVTLRDILLQLLSSERNAHVQRIVVPEPVFKRPLPNSVLTYVNQRDQGGMAGTLRE